MAREKQYVFSARTTEEGLRQLGELKAKLGVGWDELVVDAVCAHYGLDRNVMAVPKREKPQKADKSESKSGRKGKRITGSQSIGPFGCPKSNNSCRRRR